MLKLADAEIDYYQKAEFIEARDARKALINLLVDEIVADPQKKRPLGQFTLSAQDKTLKIPIDPSIVLKSKPSPEDAAIADARKSCKAMFGSDPYCSSQELGERVRTNLLIDKAAKSCGVGPEALSCEMDKLK